MLRALRTLFLGVTAIAAAATAIQVALKLLNPEQRAELEGHVKRAVEAGKEAAAERRVELENRLNELVGE